MAKPTLSDAKAPKAPKLPKKKKKPKVSPNSGPRSPSY